MLDESFEPEPAGDIYPVSGNLMSCNSCFASGKIRKLYYQQSKYCITQREQSVLGSLLDDFWNIYDFCYMSKATASQSAWSVHHQPSCAS